MFPKYRKCIQKQKMNSNAQNVSKNRKCIQDTENDSNDSNVSKSRKCIQIQKMYSNTEIVSGAKYANYGIQLPMTKSHSGYS